MLSLVNGADGVAAAANGESILDSVKNAAQSVGGGVKNATHAVGSGAKNATHAVGDTASSATHTVTKGITDATKSAAGAGEALVAHHKWNAANVQLWS